MPDPLLPPDPNSALTEAEMQRIYHDAFDRAMRHALVHVSRPDALEIGHHVASALVRRHVKADGDSADRAVHALDAFVHRSVINRLRDIWRARRRRLIAEQIYEEDRSSVAPGWTRPDAGLESHELHAVIEAAIEALPPTRRQVFLLIRRDQRSYKDVGAQLGICVGTVHTHLSRANAALRHAVAQYRADEQAGTTHRSRTIGANHD